MYLSEKHGRLSGCAKAVLLAARLDPTIRFSDLPENLQQHVTNHLAYMVTENRPVTLFDKLLVERNPAPKRTVNEFKWRATAPIKSNLLIPKFALECDIVWYATNKPNFSRAEVSQAVYHLRALGKISSLIDYVGDHGIAAVKQLIEDNLVP